VRLARLAGGSRRLAPSNFALNRFGGFRGSPSWSGAARSTSYWTWWATSTKTHSYERTATGIVKWKTLPLPTTLSAQIFPPCASTMLLQMNSPRPLPCGSFPARCQNRRKTDQPEPRRGMLKSAQAGPLAEGLNQHFLKKADPARHLDPLGSTLAATAAGGE
jgi:hypothetical protein